MIKVNTQLEEATHLKISEVVNKKDWSFMKVLRKLIELAIKEGLHKKI